ncbi:MAG: CRISPR-associated endonuclease Cas2 [Verrucomicrobiota bacterium]
MLIWVIYDITEDRDRTKIAKRCIEYGLQRVQKSVFLGDMPPHCADEIAEFSKELIDQDTDAVFILPCCEEDFSKRRVVGKKDFDEELVQDTKGTMML